MEEKIRIIIRSRGLNSREINNNESSCLSSSSNTEMSVHLTPSNGFKFSCFDLYCSDPTTQEAFFNQSGVTNLLNSVLQGYRSCIFAYGQTGAGKTYTMIGPKSTLQLSHPDCGLLGRSLLYLYRQLTDLNLEYIVRISCVELYQEQLYDLLDDKAGQGDRLPLSLREHPKHGFFVEGCQLIPCHSVNDAKRVIEKALKCRQIGSDDLNHRSNRSHFITEISVELPGQTLSLPQDISNKTNPAVEEEARQYTIMGKVSFVDLAGSELLKDTNSTCKVLQETGSINSSLYVLGKVISSLSKSLNSCCSDSGPQSVSYRDSKLTKLLINSLGGSSRTMMVTCISESIGAAQETLRTLRFTMTAARIKNRPVRFLDPQQKLILELKEEFMRLRLENQHLRKGNSSVSSASSSRGTERETDSGRGEGIWREQTEERQTRGEEGREGEEEEGMQGLLATDGEKDDKSSGKGHESGEWEEEAQEGEGETERGLPLLSRDEKQEQKRRLEKEHEREEVKVDSLGDSVMLLKLRSSLADETETEDYSLKRVQSEPIHLPSHRTSCSAASLQSDKQDRDSERDRDNLRISVSASASSIFGSGSAEKFVPILRQRRQQEQQLEALKRAALKKIKREQQRQKQEEQGETPVPAHIAALLLPRLTDQRQQQQQRQKQKGQQGRGMEKGKVFKRSKAAEGNSRGAEGQQGGAVKVRGVAHR